MLDWSSDKGKAFFPKLTNLDISMNALEKVPNLSIVTPSLETLKLVRVKLESIPFWLNKVTTLKTLILRGNDLRRVSYSLCDSMGLRTLDLSQNKISFLPLPFTRLTNLTSLNVEGNFLPFQAQDKAVFEHVENESKKKEGERRSKMMAIGNPGSGRSALLTSLTSKWTPVNMSTLSPRASRAGESSQEDHSRDTSHEHSDTSYTHSSDQQVEEEEPVSSAETKSGFRVASYLVPLESTPNSAAIPTKSLRKWKEKAEEKERERAGSESVDPATFDNSISLTVYDWHDVPHETYVSTARAFSLIFFLTSHVPFFSRVDRLALVCDPHRFFS